MKEHETLVEARIRMYRRIGEALMSEPDMFPEGVKVGEILINTVGKEFNRDFLVKELIEQPSHVLKPMADLVEFMVGSFSILELAFHFSYKEAMQREAQTN